MIDYARITVKAGDGGRGAGSFMHIKGKRLGKANGGDGGRGGDVYICATLDLNTLEPFRYVKDYEAKRGDNGAPNRRKGADGQALVLKVPVGTVVKAQADTTHEQSLRSSALPAGLETYKTYGSYTSYDLVQDGQKVLVARGGEGGRGNAHLRDEFGRRPKSGEAGRQGESLALTLELKLIADVGLIGLPNAGKSTLLAALTAATPAIAAYPFTTLEPNLGVLRSRLLGNQDTRTLEEILPGDPETQKPRNLVVADIPGLIEGASEGRGLGDLFLRHIERTKVLAHLIDVSSPTDAVDAYKTVRGELKKYSKELIKKKEIIVLNKIDLVSRETLDALRMRFKKLRKKVVAISAAKRDGLKILVSAIAKSLNS